MSAETQFDIHSVPTMTHGRVLVREARAAARRGVLVGFHGYMENARIQIERLEAIPGALEWTLVSIQGLHRFYRGRTEDVVASWMTREDREVAIADNLAYVRAALEAVPRDASTRVVFSGFSQGVAMAFRAALLAVEKSQQSQRLVVMSRPSFSPTPRCGFLRSCSPEGHTTSGSLRRNSIATYPRCARGARR